MKRIVSLLIALSMVLSVFSTVFAAASYSDLVGENAKYAGAVAALSELKVDGQPVIQGYPDGTFGPEKAVTRAELAKMLVVCDGEGNPGTPSKMIFSDVPTTHWAAGFITIAAQNKIIVGYPDGTFGPEKTVTYAEAFTMALRALGYGNVADFEGVWPSSYVNKARELGLNEDMVFGEAGEAATRGNIAILLWNMLRTPMWKVYEESENSGMTMTATDLMLTVKFPDYIYFDEDDPTYLNAVNIVDKDEVNVSFLTANRDGEIVPLDLTAKLGEIDLTRLVRGMKVSVLVKDYKKADDATVVSITPASTLVEGFAEEMKVDKNGYTTFKVNGTEYRFQDKDGAMAEALAADSTYLVFEPDGKKVNMLKVDGEEAYVCRALPIDGTYAKTQSTIDSDMDEDDLVVIDGVWADASKVEVGSVYTLVEQHDQGDGKYWVVNSESAKATFDIAYEDNVSWGEGKEPVRFISLDDEESRLAPGFKAYEKENNTKEVTWGQLTKKVKDNDYAGEEAEVFCNYLELPVRMHFGELDNSKNAGFYAITSNGAPSEGSLKGKVYNMTLVGQEGEEEELKTVVGIDLPEKISDNTSIYEVVDKEWVGPTFVWVDMNDSDEIEEVVILANGVKSGNPAAFESKYAIAAINDGAKITDKKIATTAGELQVQKSAYFFEASAEMNDKDKVESINVTVSRDRSEYEDIELPEGTLVAYDTENDNKVKYVFLMGATESRYQWGKVNAVNTTRETIELDTTSAAKLGDLEADIENAIAKDDLVAYTLDKDEEKATVKAIFDLKTLANAPAIDGNKVSDMESEDLEDYLPLTDGKSFTLDSDDSEYKDHKKYSVWVVTLSGKVGDKVEVKGVEKEEEKGHAGVANHQESWNRIVIRDDEQSILVFTGVFDEDVGVDENGKFIKIDPNNQGGDDEGDDEEEKPVMFKVTYAWSGEAVEGVDLEALATSGESGSKYTVKEIAGCVTDPSGEVTLTKDLEVVVWAEPKEDEPEDYVVTYVWSGDIADLEAKPESQAMSGEDTWEPALLDGFVADYEDDYEFAFDPQSLSEEGTVTITVTAISHDPVIREVTLDQTEATIYMSGDTTVTLRPTVSGDNTDGEVTWASSDEEVATVDGGVVTAVGSGDATITATSVDDDTKSASATIHVIDNRD